MAIKENILNVGIFFYYKCQVFGTLLFASVYESLYLILKFKIKFSLYIIPGKIMRKRGSNQAIWPGSKYYLLNLKDFQWMLLGSLI